MADTDLRQRIVAALCPSLPELCVPHQAAADTVVALVQPELDRLAAVEAAAPDQIRDGAGRVTTVPVAALARKIAEKREALAQRNEACREVDRLRLVLHEVLQTFTHKTHPGAPCLQSDHVDVETVERWRATLRGGA